VRVRAGVREQGELWHARFVCSSQRYKIQRPLLWHLAFTSTAD